MKKILLFVVVVFCISCNNKKLAPNEYELEVSIAGLADSSLLILQEPKGTIIDSTRLSNNKATFKGSLNEYPVQWVLRDLNGNYKYIWVEPSYMNVTVKDGNFFEAKITGSKIQAESDELARRIKPFEIIMDNIDNYAMKNQENLSDIEIDSLRTIYFRAEKDEELETQKFIEDKVNTYYSIHILDFYKTTFGKKVVSNLFEKFNEEYKNSDYGKSISNYLNLNKEPKIGESFRDLSLPNKNGDLVSISEINAKYLLVEFWASNCGPCRITNPKLAKIYDNYNSKGFEIYGISLDTNNENWINAMHKDGIKKWTNVIEINGFDGDAALIYGINAIPDNFLINAEGKVIARKIWSEDLEKFLQENLQ